MQYYAIAPLSHLSVLKNVGVNHHMVIAPFLERHRRYRKFYLEYLRAGDMVLLDNGIIETGVADAGLTLKWARELHERTKCNVTVVTPDVWKNTKMTLELAKQFMKQVDGPFNIMAVPHGRTVSQFLHCMHELVDMGVHIIGMPYREWDDPVGWTRAFLVRKEMLPDNVRVHLLGLWSVLELRMHGLSPRVLSFDTSLPFRLASHNAVVEPHTVDTESFNWEVRLSPAQKQLATQNIALLEQFANGEPIDIFNREFSLEDFHA